jgi:hypothetical protein
MNTPLKLSDAAMEQVKNFAAPIPPWRRSEYLQLISSALANIPDPEPAQVYKAARTAQQRILYSPRRNDGPVLDGKTGMPMTRERFTQEAANNPRFRQAPGDSAVVITGARKCFSS